MDSPSKQHAPILRIGVAVLLLVAMGMGACAYFAIHPVGSTSLSYWAPFLSLTAVAGVSFFGFMWYMQSLGGPGSLKGCSVRVRKSLI